VIYENLVSL